MAAEGTWPDGILTTPSFDAARTRAALGQLRVLLGDLEERLEADSGRPLTPQAVSGLALAFQALALKLDNTAVGRADVLHAKLVAIDARVQAQLDESEARILARLDRLERAAAAREPRLVGGLLVAASAAALLSMAGAAGWMIAQPRATVEGLKSAAAVLADLPFRRHLVPEAPARREVRAALRPLPPSRPPSSPSARDDYAAIVRALERAEAQALPRLTGLAEAGNAQAQIHLASLYETGANGLPRDLAAARLWTRKAAEGGDRVAMHNLALYLAGGEGGARDIGEAAQWFRRAADLGVVDSQYNLGLLYEAGRGVDRNLREAYRWFSLAANAGDAVSREKVVDLEAKLKTAERGELERDIRTFTPGIGTPGTGASADLIIAPATTVAETQAMLARLGYYVGPLDGASSPILKAAAAAYRHDHPVRTP